MRLLELAVDDHGAQEDEAHDDQVGELVDLEAVEQADDLAGQDGRQVELQDQERDGRVLFLKALPWMPLLTIDFGTVSDMK